MSDDASVIVSSKNVNLSNRVLSHVNKWFAANKLAVNLDKQIKYNL
jgi:hypothetical protein